MKLGPRRVGESYAEDMRETRFPIHVPGNVPGTKVQEHGWEIACASMSTDIWSRECAGGWRAMARTPVCDCVRVRVLDVRVRVLGLSAVWPWVSGRMASGIWPCGLWTLAAWRFLICAR